MVMVSLFQADASICKPHSHCFEVKYESVVSPDINEARHDQN